VQGILLAGGSGSRLSPLTKVVNKHLLPIFDKPMIYYPLTTLILAGVTELVVVTNPDSLTPIRSLLGTGEDFGIQISVVPQESAKGLPDAILAAKETLKPGNPFLVILGDNFFYGAGMGRNLRQKFSLHAAGVFTVEVPNPEEFGVIEFDEFNSPVQIHEKPKEYVSKFVVPGFYHFPWGVFNEIEKLQISSRNEYEIVDLLNYYLHQNLLEIEFMDRGTVWFDGGTTHSLMQVSEFVQNTQNRLGKLIGSPHEAAVITGLMDSSRLSEVKSASPDSGYWNML
jgi:glucose-1-phosphate thymidylyltransferase